MKPLLIVALALPLATTMSVQSSEAGSKHRRAAAIAGAIIGGAIVYNHIKKRKHYRHRNVVRYKGHRRYHRGHGRYYVRGGHRHRYYNRGYRLHHHGYGGSGRFIGFAH